MMTSKTLIGAAAAFLMDAAMPARPAPDPNCPPQYVTRFDGFGRTKYGCRYAGMIPVCIDRQLWSKTYWSTGGGSMTELSACARSLGVRGVKWIGDLQAYQAAHAAAAAAAGAAAQDSGGGGD